MSKKETKKENCEECKNLPEGEVVTGHDHRQFEVTHPEEVPQQEPISKTYSEMVVEWLDENREKMIASIDIDGDAPFVAVGQFAKWLDSMPYLFPHLELLVMKQVSKIDREFMQEMIEALGKEKAIEIAKVINAKHTHSKGHESTILHKTSEETK